MAQRLTADDLRDYLGRVYMLADSLVTSDVLDGDPKRLLDEIRQEAAAAIDGFDDPRTRYYAARCERQKTQGRPRSPLWRAIRRAHLLREPTCQACGTTDSLQVHHVVPFWLDPSQELDPANLITLCEPSGEGCHYLFGHLRRWTASNPHVREDAARYWMRVIAYRR